MELKVHNYSLSAITGILAVVIFIIFTFISVLYYPFQYNPLYDWLSNLGNINLNPMGAIFFNWGTIISGILLIPFFAGLYAWQPHKTWSKILLILGILIGIFASISFIMVGIYPETNIHAHLLAASGVFSSLFIIIIFLSLALFKNPKFVRMVAYFGLIPIIIDLIFQYTLSIYNNLLSIFNPAVAVPGLEWAAVFTSLAWVALLAINMLIKRV